MASKTEKCKKDVIEVLVKIEIEWTNEARQDAVDSALQNLRMEVSGVSGKGRYSVLLDNAALAKGEKGERP